LMDLQMPAPDGFAATAQIRRFEREHGRRRVPVVAYTSATVSVGHPRLRDSGIDAVLRKPADAQSFRECVTRWCLQEPYPLRQRAAQTHAPMALHLCGLALAAVVALLSAAPAAFAADKAAPMSAKARLQHDRAVCARIQDQGVRDECLSEASTQYAGTQPSHPDENPAQLMRNVLKRCEALRGPDRQDCVLRMQGQGTTTGSVAGGGIYRELVTREVGEPATKP